MHDAFFDVGVDVVETATFGAFSIVLAEYGIADQAYEINLAAARIAREVADGYATDGRPRCVAGSIGPGTKLPSLGHIRFAELRDTYEEQAAGSSTAASTCCSSRLQGPAAGQGGDDRLPPGHGRRRPRRPDPGAGHDGDDRAHAGRLRDRRRPHGARAR